MALHGPFSPFRGTQLLSFRFDFLMFLNNDLGARASRVSLGAKTPSPFALIQGPVSLTLEIGKQGERGLGVLRAALAQGWS